MYKIIILVIFVSFIYACQPSLQKCKDLYGFSFSYHDTTLVFTKDTLITTKQDTLTHLIPFYIKDTVTLIKIIEKYKKDRIKGDNIKLIRINDSILKIETICPKETIRLKGIDRYKIITQTVKENINTKLPDWLYPVLFFLSVFIITLVILRKILD